MASDNFFKKILERFVLLWQEDFSAFQSLSKLKSACPFNLLLHIAFLLFALQLVLPLLLGTPSSPIYDSQNPSQDRMRERNTREPKGQFLQKQREQQDRKYKNSFI